MLTIEQAEELDAKAAKGLKFGKSYISCLHGLKYQIRNILQYLFYYNFFTFSHFDTIKIYIADKTADKKSKETEENKRKRSRAKSISGYKR